jgi:hypothetical protein
MPDGATLIWISEITYQERGLYNIPQKISYYRKAAGSFIPGSLHQ